VLRVLHTSDLHLGHQLHGISRAYEHRVYLDWLVDQLVTLEIDALLVTGDVFDTANPSTQAQALWYGFLGQARRNCPNLDIVVIGGNHDSAQRLDAPKALLHELDITVIGGVPMRKGQIDVEAMVIPLRDKNRKIAAWVAAVPYIRVSDLKKAPAGVQDPVAYGVNELYTSVLRVARANRRQRQALLATGHFTLEGSKLSDPTERPVLNGTGISSETFSSDLAYVALGHLHFAQRVPGPTYLRYAGSPIPLSITERDYDHQVVVVEIDGENVRRVRAVPTPRTVRLERIGPAPLDAVVAALQAYPERGDPRPSGGEANDALLPIVQVAVTLDTPVPDLRGRIEAAAAGKALRLARITIERIAGTGAALAETYVGGESLVDITPEDVFARRYARDHEGPPSAKLLETFRELVDGVVTGTFDLDEESPEPTAEHTPPARDLGLGAQ
jgi:exonuclease SbcD